MKNKNRWYLSWWMIVIYIFIFGFLINSVIYFSSKNCDLSLKFEKITECDDFTCQMECISEGFGNGKFQEEKEIGYGENKEKFCICNCLGCKR